MKLMLKIAGGIVIALVLLTAGCAALLGSAVNEAANEIEKESNAHAITRAQYGAITYGMTRSEVEAKLGKPADDQETKIEVSKELGVRVNSQCIYYNQRGDLLPSYQFCFEDGRLDSKSRF